MDFIGAPYPIRSNSQGYLYSQKGLSQIKSDLLILLMTEPGERCFVGDTKIPLANNEEYCIKDLIDKPYFWVYSYDHDTNSIVAGKATASLTKRNAQLVEVELDNNEKVICTPNHLWMLRDGTYKRADKLLPNESLMPLYRNINTSGYERIYQPYLKDYRETHLNFVFEKRCAKEGREVVHHKDLNKRNNSPENLQWMTRQEHVDLHKLINNAFVKKFNEDVDFKKNWEEKQKNGLSNYYKTHKGNRNGAVLTAEQKKALSEAKTEYYKTDAGMETKQKLRECTLKQLEKGHPSKGKKHTEESLNKMRKPRPSICGENNPSKRPEVKEKLKLAWEKRKTIKNHKVLSVKNLNYTEDCYDLTVEKYHNFALSSGVFVHNCMLPQYGTPLRSLLFEQNDETTAAKAKQLIIDSINKWEPRITVEQLEVKSGLDDNDTSIYSEFDNRYELAHILYVYIKFFDPEDRNEVDELVLELPLSGA